MVESWEKVGLSVCLLDALVRRGRTEGFVPRRTTNLPALLPPSAVPAADAPGHRRRRASAT